MSDDGARARDAALDGVRALSADASAALPRRDQVRAHRLRAALRLRRHGAGRRRLAGLARRRLGDAGHGRRRARCAMAVNRLADRFIDAAQSAHGRPAPARAACSTSGQVRGWPPHRRGAPARRGVDAEPALPGARPARRSSSSSATPTRSASPGCRTGSSASPTASLPPAAGSPCAAAFDPPALVLWFALTVWIAGFDLIYACQDVDVRPRAGAALLPRALRRRAPR